MPGATALYQPAPSGHEGYPSAAPLCCRRQALRPVRAASRSWSALVPSPAPHQLEHAQASQQSGSCTEVQSAAKPDATVPLPHTRHVSTVNRRRAVFTAPPQQQESQKRSNSTSHTIQTDTNGEQPWEVESDAQRRQSGSHASSSSSSSSSSSNTRAAAGSAASDRAAKPPRYTAVSKHGLSKEENEDVATRLRTVTGAGRSRPLRIYRYAIDDLRLFKALEEAGLEGRCIVTDTIQGADIAFAVHNKRSGKSVNVPAARRAAANAGVPFVILRAVSALRVAQALEPLLGTDAVAVGLAARPNSAVSEHAPRRLRGDDVADDGGDALMALLLLGHDREGDAGGVTISDLREAGRLLRPEAVHWPLQSTSNKGLQKDAALGVYGSSTLGHGSNHSTSSSRSYSNGASSQRNTALTDPLAILAAQQAPQSVAPSRSASTLSSSNGTRSSTRSSTTRDDSSALTDPLDILAAQQAPRTLAASTSSSASDEQLQRAVLDQRALLMAKAPVMQWLACVDMDDDREHMVPYNPTQRVGTRLTVMRPLRHGSKLRRKRLARELAQQPEAVPW